MRVHCLHHTTFEGTANVERWAARKGYPVAHTFVSEQPLPEPEDFDLLVVFGGPMGAYEEKKYPWLCSEKRFLEQTLAANKAIFGICLGAQLVADVAGGRAYRGHTEEVGWFPVTLNDAGKRSEFVGGFPETFYPLHWHGDTFEFPPQARLLGSSACYPHQVFELGERVLGIQFHLDLTLEDVKQIVRYQRFSKSDTYFQSRTEVVAQKERFTTCLFLLHQLLEAFERICGSAGAAQPLEEQALPLKRPSRTARRRA